MKIEYLDNVVSSTLYNDVQAGGGQNNFFMILIIIIPIILVVFFIIRKKRKQNSDANSVNNQNKSDQNEVWATIKKFLKDNNDYGKEVIDSYVARRNDPHNTAQMTKEQKRQYKVEMDGIKSLKTTDPSKYKEEMKRIKKEKNAKPRELYVVLFTTRNAKTKEVDTPRAIECEVKMIKVSKNQQQRQIDVIRELDYDNEMLWIKPIKDKDDAFAAKRAEAEKKRQEKAIARRTKKQ